MSDNGGSCTCLQCGCRNRPEARFCAECGQALTSIPPGVPVPKKKPSSGGCCNLILLSMAGAAAFMWFGPVCRSNSTARRSTISLALDLPREKAEGLYDLLRPGDILVLIGKHADFIEGTHAEVRALEQFVELLTRLDGLSPRDVRDLRSRLQHEWTSKQTYKLRRSRAKALQRILRMDDVPLAVERHGSRLVVWATPEDQAIISSVAEILRGKQPQPSAPRW